MTFHTGHDAPRVVAWRPGAGEPLVTLGTDMRGAGDPDGSTPLGEELARRKLRDGVSPRT